MKALTVLALLSAFLAAPSFAATPTGEPKVTVGDYKPQNYTKRPEVSRIVRPQAKPLPLWPTVAFRWWLR